MRLTPTPRNPQAALESAFYRLQLRIAGIQHSNAVLRSADLRRQRDVRQLMRLYAELCATSAAAGGPASPYWPSTPVPQHSVSGRLHCGMHGCDERRRRAAGRPYPHPETLVDPMGRARRFPLPPVPDLASRLDCPPIAEFLVPLLILANDIPLDDDVSDDNQ